MAAIDLIVLGMLKSEPLSAYDIQKLVEYRHISEWVKISTPSVYKKVLRLAEKGFIEGTQTREGKMPEKSVYRLTRAGEEEFYRLMRELSDSPVFFFLDLNAVIVNLGNLPREEQGVCVEKIRAKTAALKAGLENNLRERESAPQIPEMGLEVLRQQYILAETIEKWLERLKISLQ